MVTLIGHVDSTLTPTCAASSQQHCCCWGVPRGEQSGRVQKTCDRVNSTVAPEVRRPLPAVLMTKRTGGHPCGQMTSTPEPAPVRTPFAYARAQSICLNAFRYVDTACAEQPRRAISAIFDGFTLDLRI